MHPASKTHKVVRGEGHEEGRKDAKRNQVGEDLGHKVGKGAIVPIAALVDVERSFQPEQRQGTD